MVQSAAIYPSDESSPYQNALRPLVQEYVDNRYQDLGWAESTHHAGRIRKMNTQIANDINSLLDFNINPEFQYQNDQPVVVDAWREDDLDSGATISKGRISFAIQSQNGITIQSRTKDFTGVSLKDVNRQIEEFLNKNYHHGMKTTEYDCKLNAKINYEPTYDHPDTSKININQDKIFSVEDLNKANEKFAEFQESWQQYFHKIHKEYNLSGNIKFNRLCKTGNAADELSELPEARDQNTQSSREHHHEKNWADTTFRNMQPIVTETPATTTTESSPEATKKATFKRLCEVKRKSPEYQNECHLKRLTAVKEGRKGARCSFHCFLSTNSDTKELEVYRVDVSIKSDRRRR